MACDAEITEISCSVERPPKNTPIFVFIYLVYVNFLISHKITNFSPLCKPPSRPKFHRRRTTAT
jgi:hypothetical protein